MRSSYVAPAWRCATSCLEAEPGTFFITPHYDRYPAVLVQLSRIDLDEMTELATEARRLCAPKRMLAAYDAEHPRPVAGVN